MGEPVSVAAMKTGVELLDKIGILEKVKKELVNNPDAAAAKLTLVLSALGRTYQIVDDTLVSFMSLTFENADAQRDALELLNKARGGQLEVQMMDARVHCHKIWFIYDRYLNAWFKKAIDEKEHEEIE